MSSKTKPFPAPVGLTHQTLVEPISLVHLSPPLSKPTSLSPTSAMADRYTNSAQTQRMQRSTSGNPIAKLVQKLQEHAPNSGQLIGLLAFLITGSVLLLLTGVTVTVSVIALIFFTPLIIISSPIWVPVGTIFFLVAFAICSTCGFGVAVVAGLSWIYKYFRGHHPPGSDRVDFARSRIYDTASHVKDYALEYGGYLQSKVKDAAPGA